MQIIEEGQIEGTFKGFKDNKTIFKFLNGNQWQQNEYKYYYHYEYMPKAKIVEEFGTYYLIVEGITDKVEVQKV